MTYVGAALQASLVTHGCFSEDKWQGDDRLRCPLSRDADNYPSFCLEERSSGMHDGAETMDGERNERELNDDANNAVRIEENDAPWRIVQTSDVEVIQSEIDEVEDSTGNDRPEDVENQHVVRMLEARHAQDCEEIEQNDQDRENNDGVFDVNEDVEVVRHDDLFESMADWSV